jgi:hypothetical protein
MAKLDDRVKVYIYGAGKVGRGLARKLAAAGAG